MPLTNINTKIKAIIFDMDGTIINTNHLWEATTVDVAKKHNACPVAMRDKMPDLLKVFSGIGTRDCIKIMQEELNITSSFEDMDKDFSLIAREKMRESLSFIEGFETFFGELQKAEIKTSIATNADPDSFAFIRNHLNLESFFGTHLYCVKDVDYKAKPHPDLFLHAAKQLGVLPSECLVFEDSVHGFKAASAAGMKCIAIENPGNQIHTELFFKNIKNYNDAPSAILDILENW